MDRRGFIKKSAIAAGSAGSLEKRRGLGRKKGNRSGGGARESFRRLSSACAAGPVTAEIADARESLRSPEARISPMPLAERVRRRIVPRRGFCSIVPDSDALLISGRGHGHRGGCHPYAEQIISPRKPFPAVQEAVRGAEHRWPRSRGETLAAYSLPSRFGRGAAGRQRHRRCPTAATDRAGLHQRGPKVRASLMAHRCRMRRAEFPRSLWRCWPTAPGVSKCCLPSASLVKGRSTACCSAPLRGAKNSSGYQARTADLTVTSFRKQDVTLIARYGIEAITAPAVVLGRASRWEEHYRCSLAENKPVAFHLKPGRRKPLDWVDGFPANPDRR